MRKKVKIISGLLLFMCLFNGCTSFNLNNKIVEESRKVDFGDNSECYSHAGEKIYEYEDVKDVVIRFHVLANSDTEEDQELKLKVRDAILKYLEPELQKSKSNEETRQIILNKEDEIKELSIKVIKSNGYDYKVNTEVARENFPEKSYGNITLPQGNYEAFRVIIGDGNGHNWWCVMFPALCFIDISKGQVEEDKSRDKLDKVIEENKNENVEVKFKIIEIIKNFFK